MLSLWHEVLCQALSAMRCSLWVLYVTFSLADPAPGPGAYLSLPTPGTKEVLSPRATAPAFAFGSSQRFIVKQVGPERTAIAVHWALYPRPPVCVV